MGGIASINFKPTKNPVQVFHNDRSTPPNYLLPKERQLYSICNRSGLEAQALKQQMIDKAISAYTQKVKQKFQAKTYVYSAVVNLKDTTTMQDLEKLATHFKDKYGIQCYQIAIHRDEGHIDEFGNTHINHHAHMEFVTLDENTGKNNFKRVPSLMLKQIQTEVAQILGMQRGTEKRISGAKRIEPRAYAKLMEQEKVKRIALNESQTKEVKNYQEQIQNLQASAKSNQAELNTLKQDKTSLELANTTLQQESTALIQENQELKDHSTELEATLIDLTSLVAPQNKQGKLTLKEAKPLLESVRKQMIAINQGLGDLKLFTQEDYKALRALKEEGLSIADLKNRITQIEREAKERYKTLQEQYKDHLSPEQVKDKVTATAKQYEKHLSPEQVEDKITATKALYKDYLSPSAVKELRQKHTKELELREQSHTKALQEKDSALEKMAQELRNKDTEHAKALDTLQTQHAQELEQAKRELEKKAKPQEYANKLKDLLQSFIEQVVSPVLEKLQAEKGVEIEAVIQWKKQNEQEKAKYHAYLAALADDLIAGKFSTINAMAKLFGKGVKDAMSPQYFESIAKDRRDRFLKQHIGEIEKKLNQELKPIIAKIEQTIATEFKGSAEYGAELSQAQRQVDSLEYDKKQLQSKINSLEQEKENTKRELQEAHANKEVLRKSVAENTKLKDELDTAKAELQTTKDKLQTTQSDLDTTKTELEATKVELKGMQNDLGALDRLGGVVYAKIAEIGKISPEVAQALEIKASNALNDLARLREELPEALAQVKAKQEQQKLQEQEQKGSGGKHI
ncbi:hypothetical protein [Helicobacter gastrofelis]|uniref:hypothetical protein n=1 Tax=Helicobacter gastrofelis TaxID=2849642 RepID=UPI0021A33551|nr:hypothetical protein [Helicobacter sp. NHP19-012]